MRLALLLGAHHPNRRELHLWRMPGATATLVVARFGAVVRAKDGIERAGDTTHLADWHPDVVVAWNDTPIPASVQPSRTIHISDAVRTSGDGAPDLVVTVAEDGRACEDRAALYSGDAPVDVRARALELGLRLLAEQLGPAPRPPRAAPPAEALVPLDAPQMAAICASLKPASTVRALTRRMLQLVLLGVYRPVRDLVRAARRRHPIRIFTFHRVTELCRDGMTVPLAVFRRQLAYVRQFHDIVPLSEAIALAASDVRLKRPVAVLTFDDGYGSVAEAAAPILAEQGIPATCFVCTALCGTEQRFPHDADNPVREHLRVMSWDEIAALARAGWSIGSHGATHTRLSACPPERLREELERPLADLRERLGLRDVAIAYPFGKPGDLGADAEAMIAALGYTACFSDFGGENLPPAAPLQLRRIELGGRHDELAWRGFVHGIAMTSWGHMWQDPRDVPRAGTPRPLRIAQIVSGLLGGGLEKMVVDLTALRARGHLVEVFCAGPPGVYAEQLRAAGVVVHECDVRPRIPGIPLRLVRLLARFSPDVLHGHSGVWLPAATARRVLGRPLVFTDHGRYPDEGMLALAVQRYSARAVDRLAAVSAPLGAYAHGVLRLRRAPAVVPNGIDLTPYRQPDAARRAALRSAWGLSDDAVAVGILGGLEPVKNHEGLFRALAALAAELPALHVVVIGEGTLEPELRALVTALGLDARVRFLGFRRDVADCLLACDLLAMPSHTEGLPLSLLEAMAAGLAIVASRVGGIPEVLQEPPAGILVPPGDTEALADALRRVGGDAALSRLLGDRARARAEAYTVERMAEAYEALYEDSLSAAAARAR